VSGCRAIHGMGARLAVGARFESGPRAGRLHAGRIDCAAIGLDYPDEVKGLVLMTVAARPKTRAAGGYEMRLRAARAGHFSPTEIPDKVNALIGEFVATL